MDNFLLVNFTASYLVTGTVLLILAIYVWLKNKKRLLNKIFAVYSLTISWWCFLSVPMIQSEHLQIALTWDRLCLMGVVFIPTSFLHFTLVFLNIEKERGPKIIIQGAYVISVLFLLLVWTPLFVPTVEPKDSIKFFSVPGPVYHVFLVYFFLTICSCLFLLGVASKDRKNRYSPLIAPGKFLEACFA